MTTPKKKPVVRALGDDQAEAIEQDHHAWIVQPKIDGVRALIHIEDDRVRITSRTVSEVTYRLSEFQDNLPHLTEDLARLGDAILDGELACPMSNLNTGSTVTASALQATMAILTTSLANARGIQKNQNAHIRFHAFDILQFHGQNLTSLPLAARQDFVVKAVQNARSSFLDMVPSFVVGKAGIHRRIIEGDGEGTVWKKADQPYVPGRRVGHWLKRKRGIEMEAFVTGHKPGTNGHANMVGALEFSVRNAEGEPIPVAWVSNWNDTEREEMTDHDTDGVVRLSPRFLGRKARIMGQDESAKSRRLRHARIMHWVES